MTALIKKLRADARPCFDYASLNDPDLELHLRTSTNRIHELQRAAIVDIGRELLAVKDRLPHGKFLLWLEAEFGWGRRTAVNYMQVASELGGKWATVSHLHPSTLYLLAAPSTPAEVRAAVLEGLDPNRVVTADHVRRLIQTVQNSEFRKRRKETREEERREYEKRQDHWDAEHEKRKERWEKEDSKAREAAEQIRFMLGEHFLPAAELLASTKHVNTVIDALIQMAATFKMRKALEAGQ